MFIYIYIHTYIYIYIYVGIIGGTVTEIREKLLPQLRRKMISDLGISKKTNNCMKNKNENITNDDDVEIIVVVICGLNDWKKLLDNFPFGTGPITYKQDLGKLIGEIKDMGGDLSAKLKVCMDGWMCVCVCVNVCVYIFIYIYIYICMYVFMNIYIYIYTYIHTSKINSTYLKK
jgi:hypothetical protein